MKNVNTRIYEARPEEVHSADDFILLVNLGIDGLYKKTRVRLHGVDAPNAYKARADTEAGRVRDEVKELLSGKCLVEVISEGKGGWIAVVTIFNDLGQAQCLNTMLRERGYIYNATKTS